jgi:hypothetical protein
MKKTKHYPLNLGEAAVLKAAVYDLSQSARLQVIWAIINDLSLKSTLTRNRFEDIIDDARKLTGATKTNG